METKCKSCGGSMNRSGNYYVCEFCGNKWEIDSSNDVHAVDRANAWRALRDGDFEKAAELFEHIIAKESNNHEAYWGRALAMGGIVYVTDMNENKKVPTCNNITEESFSGGKDVRKAISLAPSDIAESYKKQADYIEKVRIEWLEKASKEPAYDVFISYKDSDRENGIERTQDSIDAQDLYHALVAEGYKVFFSRVSLRDKISEQYEPYIYNAIKTAKVMIVFGEKPEYFSSVWIKNEWSRFKTRIANAEKHKNSLVVVYKNLNPSDLPVVLRSRQCLNAADMTFLSDLNRHIQRVIAETQKSARIEKISVQGGQVAKKATTLNTNTVQIRQVGQGAIAETDINEQQRLELLNTFLSASQWNDAVKIADDILFGNPNCAEALWYKLLAGKKVNSAGELLKNLRSNDSQSFFTVEKTLDCASKTFADSLLTKLYACAPDAPDGVCAKLLEKILPYAFADRQKRIDHCFQKVVNKAMSASFEVLLTTLGEDQVDDYIQYHLQFAERTKDSKLQASCLNKVLSVDEGNIPALKKQLEITLQTAKTDKEITEKLENLLKFAPNPDEVVVENLIWLSKNADSAAQTEFSKQLLRYYSGEINELMDMVIVLAEHLIENRKFTTAEHFLQLALAKNQNDPRLFWDLCLVKVQARTEAEIPNSRILLSGLPEYTKYLTLVDNNRRLQCIKLSEKQQKNNRTKEIDALWKTCQKKAGFTDSDSKVIYEFYTKQLLVNLPEYQQLLELTADPAPYQKIAKDQIDCLKKQREDLRTAREQHAKNRTGGIVLAGLFGIMAVFCPIMFFGLASEYGMDTGAPFMLFLGALAVGITIYGVHTIKKEHEALQQIDQKIGQLDTTLSTAPAPKGLSWR